ncbi:MAG: class I SAM-dependent methyltransferase [Candidatus Methanomethylicaceae archaeon]
MAMIIQSRNELVSHYAPAGVWAELGVEAGNFSAEMLRRKDVRELWLIDCWNPYPNADLRDPTVWSFEKGEELLRSVIARFCGDHRVRILRSLIEDAALSFPREYFDFVYIDAAHSYEAVKKHLDLYYPLVRRGGMIAGHDYWKAESLPWIEVRPAVDDWCRENGLKISIISDEPCGSFAIIKP